MRFNFALRLAESKDGKGILISDLNKPGSVFVPAESVCYHMIEEIIASFIEPESVNDDYI
jgi:hypothetical protein